MEKDKGQNGRRKETRVLVVGSAEQSAGGVASAIRLMKRMPAWKEYRCYWLGTQIQRSKLWKLWYAVKGNLTALFIIWRFSIVHLHTVPDRICLVIQLPIFLLARLGRKKIIMHVHMGNQLRNHTENRLFKWCLNRVDLVVLLAKKWQRLFEESFKDVKTPTAVLYNACEPPTEVALDAKEPVVFMAAYFNDNKAPDLLLKAWKSIKDRHSEWRLFMLGNGEVERFKAMAQAMGLDDVEFTGYIEGKEKEDFFRRASIYCMCSYEEGFPMVVLEAWAHGIDVVTTPVGGLPDVLDEGRNALTFGFGDWQGLAAQLERLMDDPELREEMAEYARRFVQERFSLESIGGELRRIYEEVRAER